MQLFHLYHNHKFYKAIHSDFALFEASVWLHTFARSLIAVFIPIFLIRLGYSLNEVIFYYVAMNVVDVPFNFAAEKMVEKIGARRVVIAATIASIAYFSLLYNLPAHNWLLLFLLAAIDGIYDTCYWIAHLYLFLKSSGGADSVSRKTGILNSVRTFAGMLGPLLGGAVLIFSGQKTLIAVSIIFFAISIAPLLKLRHAADKPAGKRIPLAAFMAAPAAKRDYFARFLISFHSAADGILWPLFIYSMFNIESVAYIAVIVSLSTVVFSYFTGLISTAKQMRAVIIGSAAVGVIWITRLIMQGLPFYYVSVILMGFFTLLVDIPLDADVFRRARTGDALRVSTLRNTFSMAGQLFIFLLLAILVNVFRVGFTLAALAMFLAIAVIYIFAAAVRRQNPVPG